MCDSSAMTDSPVAGAVVAWRPDLRGRRCGKARATLRVSGPTRRRVARGATLTTHVVSFGKYSAFRHSPSANTAHNVFDNGKPNHYSQSVAAKKTSILFARVTPTMVARLDAVRGDE